MKKDIGVCILDSGIYAKHSEFEDRVDCFMDFVNDKELPYDDNGHGTHVSGIMAGKSLSIANDARIISCKVLDNKGRGSISTLCKACSWIINNKEKYNVRVVNISVGANFDRNDYKKYRLLACVENLCDSGVIVVCAAGNNGPKDDSITAPGTSDKVITVGAVDDEYSRKKGFSGRGATRNGIIKPDFVSFGANIISASMHGGYEYRSGTSMAAPKVGQVVASILKYKPEYTCKQVKSLLKSMAIDMHKPVNIQGFGLIEPRKCVEKITML